MENAASRSLGSRPPPHSTIHGPRTYRRIFPPVYSLLLFSLFRFFLFRVYSQRRRVSFTLASRRVIQNLVRTYVRTRMKFLFSKRIPGNTAQHRRRACLFFRASYLGAFATANFAEVKVKMQEEVNDSGFLQWSRRSICRQKFWHLLESPFVFFFFIIWSQPFAWVICDLELKSYNLL